MITVFSIPAKAAYGTPVRIQPSGKRFRTHNLLGQGSENRLEPGTDSPASYSIMKLICKISFLSVIHIRLSPYTYQSVLRRSAFLFHRFLFPLSLGKSDVHVALAVKDANINAIL
jgi:hypothetical protein